jgi:PEP-CTERM motif
MRQSLWLITVLLLFVSVGALNAHANSFIYTYQGNPFTTFTPLYVCSPGPCEIEGSFTVSSQLFAGLTNATVTPTSFTFTDDNGLTVCGFSCGLTGIDVTGIKTDALGNIIGWDVYAQSCFGHCVIQTNSTGGTSMDNSTPDAFSNTFTQGSNTGIPGTWTCQDQGATGGLLPCPAAPSVPTPEPSSLPLVGSGLLGLMGLAYGRKLLV